MPDKEGNDQGNATDTPLHGYKDGREDEIQTGSRGVDGNTPEPEPGSKQDGSYQDGGHPSEAEHDSAATASGGAEVKDDSSGGFGGADEPERSPERSAAYDAARSPRGTDRSN